MWLAPLESKHIQQRDGRCVFIDLVGKEKGIRTVPLPPFVKVAIDAWTAAAGTSKGLCFVKYLAEIYRKDAGSIERANDWHVVTKYARQTGLVDTLAHDMGRTCANLCRESAGDLEQIQFLLGHGSIQATERCVGSRQNLKEAVNDRLGLGE
jgi:integrase